MAGVTAMTDQQEINSMPRPNFRFQTASFASFEPSFLKLG
jgi:hypothetical protein